MDLSPKVTKYLYILIAFCYLACHIDLGILAVSTDAIRLNLNITSSQMGLLASALYLGNVLGSLLGPFIFGKIKAKNIIVISSIMNALMVAVFNFVTNYWILFSSRVLVGLFQVMFVIYFPVWIDQHAPQASQTMWISFYFLTVPVGLIIGYFATSLMMGSDLQTDAYRWAFLIQTVLMLFPTALAFMLFPAKYFEKVEEGNENHAINKDFDEHLIDNQPRKTLRLSQSITNLNFNSVRLSSNL